MFTGLAKLAHRRPKRVVALALVVAIAAGALGGSVADRLAPYGAEDPATESVHANDLIARGGIQPGVDLVVLARNDRGIERLAAELRREPGVGRVVSSRQGGRDLISKDGRSAYLAVSFRSSADDGDTAEALSKRYESRPGVTLGGAALAEHQVNEQVSKDLSRAELLAFPVLFVLSLLFFRSLVAALLPLMVGGLSIVLTFLGLRIGSEVGDISVFALNLVTGLGLGLDRLQPLHCLALPRGAGALGARLRGAAAHARHRRADGAVQLADCGRGTGVAARVPAAVPLLDGAGRHDGRADCRGRRADRAARRARAARDAGELAGAAPPSRRGRPRCPERGKRLLVPPLACRHAPARAHRDS
jgi:hypothetical protein